MRSFKTTTVFSHLLTPCIYIAAVNTLVTLVLIELLGGDRLADAFGWLNFFGGIGYITGPVVAGQKLVISYIKYSRPSVARTLMAPLPRPFQTRFECRGIYPIAADSGYFRVYF